MDASPHAAPARLLDACERLLCQVTSLDDLTTRRIASAAEVAPSMVIYHFGALEDLIVAVAERVYRRLNTERLMLLHDAVDHAAPDEPRLEDVIIALIGPSIRWSLDPTSAYPVLSHYTSLAQRQSNSARHRHFIDDVEHHRAFTTQFKRLAPWLDDGDIGWRISCALGIRSQVTRSRARTRLLTGADFDLDNPDVVIARMVEVIAPMFRRPD